MWNHTVTRAATPGSRIRRGAGPVADGQVTGLTRQPPRRTRAGGVACRSVAFGSGLRCDQWAADPRTGWLGLDFVSLTVAHTQVLGR